MRPVVVLLALLLASCQSGAARGASCARPADCGAGLVCALDACRAACRESRDCAPGERCLVEPSTGVSVCSVQTVDDCTTHGCPDGLVCASNQCVNACGSVVRCPDGVCVADVCMTIVPDGGTSDAGTPDASTPDASVDANVPRDAAPNCHGPGCDPIVQIVLGESGNAVEESWTLAVTASGALWGWGFALDGLLGDRVSGHGTCPVCSTSPVRAIGPEGTPFSDVLEVSTGVATCVRRRDQSVWCWGANFSDARGDGGIAGDNPTPHRVLRADPVMGNVPLDGALALRSGGDFSCVIRGPSREVWCWGTNTAGGLGDGVTTDAPVAILATRLGTGVMDLALVGASVLVQASDGSLHGLGDDVCGQLGVAASATNFALVDAPEPSITSFALGGTDACVLTSGGLLRCWGTGGAALGGGTPTLSTCASCTYGDCTAMPQTVLQPTGHSFEHIFGRSQASFFGVAADGSLYAWGGQFGGPFEGLADPAVIAVPEPVAEAYVAGTGACARTVAGDVYCWGGNAYGQLGRGTMDAIGDPTPGRVVWP